MLGDFEKGSFATSRDPQPDANIRGVWLSETESNHKENHSAALLGATRARFDRKEVARNWSGSGPIIHDHHPVNPLSGPVREGLVIGMRQIGVVHCLAVVGQGETVRVAPIKP